MEIQFNNFPNIHSIPAQFPLNAFFLRFSYAYLTAKQYHTGTTYWINQYENGGIFYVIAGTVSYL